MTCVAICGGHLTPALAIIEELEKRKNLKIIFFGRKFSAEGAQNYSAEYRIIQERKNITFLSITTGRLQRKFTKFTIPSLAKIPIGFAQSFFYLIKYRPQVVVSFGGYLSLPVVFCAWSIGIDCLIHEQSALPGLANRIGSLFTRKVFLTWPATGKFFPRQKSQVIGNLTRAAIYQKSTPNAQIQKFLNQRGRLLFVTGGNLGSHFLNQQIFSLVPKLKKYLIFHQVGTANFEGDLQAAKRINLSNYLAVDYLGPDEIGAVINRADLVISRSGANTVWDLAILAKVAILIPLPIAAGGEQKINAQILQNAGSAIVIDQKAASLAVLAKAIKRVFANHQNFLASAQKFAQTLTQTAAQSLAQEIWL